MALLHTTALDGSEQWMHLEISDEAWERAWESVDVDQLASGILPRGLLQLFVTKSALIANYDPEYQFSMVYTDHDGKREQFGIVSNVLIRRLLRHQLLVSNGPLVVATDRARKVLQAFKEKYPDLLADSSQLVDK